MRSNLIRCVGMLAFWGLSVTPADAQGDCKHPRIISVTGNAEIRVAPDQARLTLGVDSHDKDLVVAKTNSDQHIKKLMALARDAGVQPKNIQTSTLTMGPEYSDEKIPKLLGYEVSQTVTITLTDLSKYDDLMTSSLKTGVNRVDGIEFFVADPTKYREEARLKAVQAAREKATTMAAELGQTLGKPWEIREEVAGDGSVTANFARQNVQYRMPMRQEASTVAGGEVTISAIVRASFQLE